MSKITCTVQAIVMLYLLIGLTGHDWRTRHTGIVLFTIRIVGIEYLLH